MMMFPYKCVSGKHNLHELTLLARHRSLLIKPQYRKSLSPTFSATYSVDRLSDVFPGKSKGQCNLLSASINMMLVKHVQSRVCHVTVSRFRVYLFVILQHSVAQQNESCSPLMLYTHRTYIQIITFRIEQDQL